MTITRSSILVLLLLSAIFSNVARGADNKYVPSARKADVKYIRCEVCELLVKQILRQFKEKQEKKAPKKLTEMEVIEMTERVCDIKFEEGDWIQWLDIQEQGTKLKLAQQSEVGECLTECKTIQKACQELMGDSDTDIAELLYSGEANRAALSKLLCRQLSKACSTKTPPVPADREAGEPFTPKSADEVERERLTRNMNAMPMPGGQKMKIYSREELMEKTMKDMKKPGDDDEEEDDEDDVEEVPVRKPKDGTPPPSQPKSPIRPRPTTTPEEKSEVVKEVAPKGPEGSKAWMDYVEPQTKYVLKQGQMVAKEAHKKVSEVVDQARRGVLSALEWVKEQGKGLQTGRQDAGTAEL